MATNNNVKDFIQSIVNAVGAKTGDSNINAQNLPAKINGLMNKDDINNMYGLYSPSLAIEITYSYTGGSGRSTIYASEIKLYHIEIKDGYVFARYDVTITPEPHCVNVNDIKIMISHNNYNYNVEGEFVQDPTDITADAIQYGITTTLYCKWRLY